MKPCLGPHSLVVYNTLTVLSCRPSVIDSEITSAVLKNVLIQYHSTAIQSHPRGVGLMLSISQRGGAQNVHQLWIHNPEGWGSCYQYPRGVGLVLFTSCESTIQRGGVHAINIPEGWGSYCSPAVNPQYRGVGLMLSTPQRGGACIVNQLQIHSPEGWGTCYLQSRGEGFTLSIIQRVGAHAI